MIVDRFERLSLYVDLVVTGAVEIGEGDFALFLPGERYIVKCDGRCRKYTLE